MYQVMFNVHDEFLTELKLNKDLVHADIVRTTVRQKSSATMPIKHLEYVATAVVCDTAGSPQYLMVLNEYCGQIMGIEPSDNPTRVRLDRIGEMVEAVIDELELDHRHGVVEIPA